MHDAFARAAVVAGLVSVLPSTGLTEPKATVGSVTVYQGLCEASAAAVLDDQRCVVASDEFNELYIYERGNPVATRTPNLLGVKKSDLEAAARVGDRIYWLSSHSLKKPDKKNRNDPARRVLFATDIAPSNDGAGGLKLVGPVNGSLREALPSYSPSLDELIDIEGVAATPAGTLLVGFRRPTLDGYALVVELLNPKEATEGGAAPVLGPYHMLDLGGRGIRSLEQGSRSATGTFPF